MVSKTCWLASTTNTNYGGNPLSEKVTISFQHSQLHPARDHSMQEKYIFAYNNNIDIDISISTSDLLNLSSTLSSIPQNRLRIILKIRNLAELNQLQTLFSNQPNIKFVDKIKELDFKEFDLNNNFEATINAFFSTISNKLNLFSSLTNIAIGKITDITLNPSQLLDNLINLSIHYIEDSGTLNLPDSMKSLATLRIEKFGDGCTINFPASLNNLTHLTIRGNLTASPLQLPDLLNDFIAAVTNSKTTFTLPSSLPSLSTLILSDIGSYVTLIFPNVITSLTNLSLKNIASSNTLNLPRFFDNLTSLSLNGYQVNLLPISFTNFTSLKIDHIFENDPSGVLPNKLFSFYIKKTFYATTNLSAFSNLKNLTIGNIGKELVLNLPLLNKLLIEHISDSILSIPVSLINLTDFEIGNASTGVRLNLPNSLVNLKNLSIKSITSEPTKFSRRFTIDASHNRLINLSIGKISDGVTLQLPETLHHLTNLSLGTIGKDFLILSPGLPKLTKLFIGEIERHSEFKVPNCPNLSNLSIKTIGHYAKFTLRYTLDNLLSLSIGYINKFTTTNLDNSLKNLKNLDIGYVGRDSTFTLPDTLDNLTNLTIGVIGDNTTVKLPVSLPNLKSLSTYPFGKLILPDSMIALENLTIGRYPSHQATLILPDAPNELKYFIIESDHDDSTRKFLALINARINGLFKPESRFPFSLFS